ncbi:MAG: hypothetical protein ACLTZT_13990 [Butyricimonas faecalis]
MCVCFTFLNSFEDAEDVVQEVFVNFWEKKKGASFRVRCDRFFWSGEQGGSLSFAKF